MSEPKDEKWKAAWLEFSTDGKINDAGLKAFREKMELPEPKPEFKEKVKAIMGANDGWITWPEIVQARKEVEEGA